MIINVNKIIEMWDKKNLTSEERKKDFKSIINYYDNITININAETPLI